MSARILLSGDHAEFSLLDFDGSKLRLVANYPAPFNASWVEPASSHGSIDRLIGLSEGEEAGLLFTFDINHAQQTCTITSEQPTLGSPAHFITLQDNSALALATYLGGSVALYPISDGLLSDSPRAEVVPAFAHSDHGPNQGRQRQCHVHQMLEDKQGLLYAPDLGSDRVWMLCRDDMSLNIAGWLQCPPGTGPRHAVLTPDESIMYVIGELSHNVVAFEMTTPTDAIAPIEGFSPNIIPPSVHPDHQFMMDSAEICLHPSIPNVLYVSNRAERHLAEREPHYQNGPEELPPGDAVAVILLSSDGRKVEKMTHVRTNVDFIRGMRLSADGKFVVVAGQLGGGVEIYAITGLRGDVWTLVAGLSDGLEGGIKHAVWL